MSHIIFFTLLLIAHTQVYASTCDEKSKELGIPNQRQVEEFLQFINATRTEHFKYQKSKTSKYWITHSEDFVVHGALFIADVNNDGKEEYVWITTSGTGHSETIDSIYRKEGIKFVPAPFLPGFEPPANSGDKFDHGVIADPFITEVCGKITLNFINSPRSPVEYKKRYKWEDGQFARLCSPSAIEDTRKIFKNSLKSENYENALSYLDEFRRACATQLQGETLQWILSDLALAAYKSAAPERCLTYIAQAEGDQTFATSSEKVKKALAYNRGLCEGKQVKHHHPFKTLKQWCSAKNLNPETRRTVEALCKNTTGEIKKIHLDGCITELAPFAALSHLETLEIAGICSYTGARGIIHDLRPLWALKNLKSLQLSEVDIEDLTPLAKLELEHFSFSPPHNQAAKAIDLSMLKGNKSLRSLSVHTRDVNFSTLPILPDLNSLKLSTKDKEPQLSILAGFDNLRLLSISMAASGLFRFPQLTHVENLQLALTECEKILDLTTLSHLSKLQYLKIYCYNFNKIKIVSHRALPELRFLDLQQMTTIDTAMALQLPKLRALSLDNFVQGPSLKGDELIGLREHPTLCEIEIPDVQTKQKLIRDIHFQSRCDGEIEKMRRYSK